MGRPRRWPKNAKQTAFKMDRETWEGLQWLAKRYDASASDVARQAIRMLVAIEQKRAKKVLSPLIAPALKEPPSRVTKAYEFLFGNNSKG